MSKTEEEPTAPKGVTLPFSLRDPRALIPAVLLGVAALGTGSYFGLTIEPEETTALRIENGVLKERTENLEAKVEELLARVSMLEEVADSCRKVVEAYEGEEGR